MGTAEQRAKAVEDLATLKRGSRPAGVADVRGRCSVANARFAKPREGDVRIDRNANSPMANPVRVGRYATRSQACEVAAALLHVPAHEDDAVFRIAAAAGVPDAAICAECVEEGSQSARLAAVEALATRLANGHDVRLICYCAPARCHGDDIARAASERARAMWNRAKRPRQR